MIFILGVARSGTTILYNSLAQHKDLAYFCTPFLRKKSRVFLLLKPLALEGSIWHRFGETEYVDETKNYKQEFIQSVEDCKKYWKRKDFINKYPSLCLRLKWINSIYPDAVYVIIKRNRKANLQSLAFHMGVTLDQAEKYRKPFEHYLLQDKHILKNKIEFFYEDFIKTPRNFCKNIIEINGLQWYNKIKIPNNFNNLNFRHNQFLD